MQYRHMAGLHTAPAAMDTPTALLNRGTILSEVICSTAETCSTWQAWTTREENHSSQKKPQPFAHSAPQIRCTGRVVSRADALAD